MGLLSNPVDNSDLPSRVLILHAFIRAFVLETAFRVNAERNTCRSVKDLKMFPKGLYRIP